MNIKIRVQYGFCAEDSYVGYCPTLTKTCTIKDIIIYNNNIESINLDVVKGICDKEDKDLIQYIFETAEKAILPLD